MNELETRANLRGFFHATLWGEVRRETYNIIEKRSF